MCGSGSTAWPMLKSPMERLRVSPPASRKVHAGASTAQQASQPHAAEDCRPLLLGQAASVGAASLRMSWCSARRPWQSTSQPDVNSSPGQRRSTPEPRTGVGAGPLPLTSTAATCRPVCGAGAASTHWADEAASVLGQAASGTACCAAVQCRPLLPRGWLCNSPTAGAAARAGGCG